MNKIRITFVGNLITLPWSPDHWGILQTLNQFKSDNTIEDYQIIDCHQVHSLKLDITALITQFQPTLIVHGMTDSLSSEWPEKIANVLPGVIQVMSMWDFRPVELRYDNLWDRWRQSGPFLKLVTLSNKEQLEWWEKDFGVPTMFWPHGCVIKDVEYDEKYNYDCVFTGARNTHGVYNERTQLLDRIDELLKNRGKSITWVNQPGGDMNADRAEVWKDIGKIYHSAKTVLDVSHFWHSEGYASGRSFYISGLGGCSITKRFPGCEDLFPVGTKDYFDTPEEAVEKIIFYIENEKERNELKIQGKKWANQHHNYNLRFLELFDRLNIPYAK